MTYQTYLVGGAVRDLQLKKLGYDVHSSDRDWVVVGASAKELADQGFIPVGADFPVFLHPQTHEEYALARTERNFHMYRSVESPMRPIVFASSLQLKMKEVLCRF